VQILQRHTAPIWTVALHGNSIASGSVDNVVYLYTIQAPYQRRELRGHTGRIIIVTFHPDGTILASCSEDHTIRLWYTATGECIRTLRGHTSRIWSIEFQHDGAMLVSGGDDSTIRIWDIHTGDCLQTLRPPRPYEGMNITGATGLTDAQRETLRALGAVV
jgi:WD40 repeat protein